MPPKVFGEFQGKDAIQVQDVVQRVKIIARAFDKAQRAQATSEVSKPNTSFVATTS